MRHTDSRRQPKATPGGWYYHPFEIAICGFKGSGKTTLCEKLIARLTDDGLSVGFVKHDAHRFELDKPGKDTKRAKDAGASAVFIQDPSHAGIIVDHGPVGADHGVLEQSVAALDALIVEGNKRSPLAKLVLLDPRGELEAAVDESRFEGARAVVYPDGEAERARGVAAVLGGVPVVCRDDVESLVDLLHDERQRRVPPINGLVLAGGRSSRMGRDKAWIEYRGRSEARRAADLLAPHCNRVVVSSRADQALPGDCGGLERINDRFVGFGPLGGILTAMSEDARAAWLVVSCDLPLLEEGDVEQLVRARNPLRVATAFASHASASCVDDELLPEPLCAIYEPKARGRMLAMLARGALCPRWILRTGGTALVEPARGEAVFNANDAEEYEQALALIGGTR